MRIRALCLVAATAALALSATSIASANGGHRQTWPQSGHDFGWWGPGHHHDGGHGPKAPPALSPPLAQGLAGPAAARGRRPRRRLRRAGLRPRAHADRPQRREDRHPGAGHRRHRHRRLASPVHDAERRRAHRPGVLVHAEPAESPTARARSSPTCGRTSSRPTRTRSTTTASTRSRPSALHSSRRRPGRRSTPASSTSTRTASRSTAGARTSPTPAATTSSRSGATAPSAPSRCCPRSRSW